MRPEFEGVSHVVTRQNEHIELFSSDTKEHVLKLLSEELEELVETIHADETNEVGIISEIGDVQYLLMKLGSMCGIDIMEAVLSKVARNYKKYKNETDKQEARDKWGNKDKEFLSKWTQTYREKQMKKTEANL